MDTEAGPYTGERRVRLADAELEATVSGVGEPVLVIPTAVNPYELAPLAGLIIGSGRYRVIQYGRRGSGASSPAERPATIDGEAADAAALLRSLGIARTHVIGASYSSAIALALASAHPDLVATLAVHEPPPMFVPAKEDFLAANRSLLQSRDERGARATLEAFEDRLDGPTWREDLERFTPGSVSAVEREADLFFDHDIPALMSWRFDAEQARTIECPVLSLGGSGSGPWFAEVHTVLAEWLPHALTVVLDGADHSMMLNRAPQVAALITGFLGEHAMV
ncbi:alpha/beta fold hydrolase [Raineyella fluvialis]|uniref:Alpha/beta fold hydrolase n=1 Tax=Raineyella fluvialis TaxID=2662261 RepID=A0A5Q2FFI9_9ACTN|nr:alpha/beta hydrolase [Raineyella fluvialis]QGF23046.1 alpha/beta fold hydrolase [Raineyella fluvialis]